MNPWLNDVAFHTAIYFPLERYVILHEYTIADDCPQSRDFYSFSSIYDTFFDLPIWIDWCEIIPFHRAFALYHIAIIVRIANIVDASQ